MNRTTGQDKRKHADTIIFGIVLVLLGLGMVMVLSSSSFHTKKDLGEFYFFEKQLLFSGLGLAVLWGMSKIPYRVFQKLALPFFVVSLAFLVLVLVFGIPIKGATRWLSLGFISFQPSEIAKLSLVVYLAYSISKRRDAEGFVNSVFNHLIFPSVMLVLIMVEPDYGTTVLLICISFVMIFAGGARIKHLLMITLPVVSLLAFCATKFDHVRSRLEQLEGQLAFINSYLMGEVPDYSILGYHVRKSLISFGSGGLWGVGLGEGNLKMRFLPEAHNDFILAIIGHELGFIGIAAVFLLFGLLAIRGYAVALQTREMFGRLLAFGVTTLIMTQFLVNAGVVMGILPCTGVTLPLISYGGSSLLVTMASIGVLLNISRFTTRRSNTNAT